MARKKLVWKTDSETGCITPVSHKLNHDGYFRKNFGGKRKMYHVYVWEQEHGPLPEGYEVHHTCKNRACCNPEHLEAIYGTEHTIQGNAERYADRYAKAFEYWKKTGCTGTALGEKFGMTYSTGCRWIRQWKGKAQRLSNVGVVGMAVSAMLSRSARQRASHSLMI